MNLVTPKAEAKHELLYIKLASDQRITKFIVIIDINSVRSKVAAKLKDFVDTSQMGLLNI
jgi:hypothetical protein